MTQEDKELLLEVFCAGLPYEIKGIITFDEDKNIFTIKGIYNILFLSDNECCHIEDFKPYLRPMSSMTEEEYDQLYIDSRVKEDSDNILDALANDMDAIDWLNAHHFDYRGLIEKDLAIEVTEENNPY